MIRGIFIIRPHWLRVVRSFSAGGDRVLRMTGAAGTSRRFRFSDFESGEDGEESDMAASDGDGPV